jgi:hypothetical protein
MTTADFLTPDEYLTLVAPVLETCATLAAERGDPTLHADLPSMLAVTVLIDGLAELHRAARRPLGQGPAAEVYGELPFAVAVMVLLENGIEPPRLAQMETALRAIHARIVGAAGAAGTLPPPAVLVAPAWALILEGRGSEARAALRLAAREVMALVEAEDTVGGVPKRGEG